MNPARSAGIPLVIYNICLLKLYYLLYIGNKVEAIVHSLQVTPPLTGTVKAYKKYTQKKRGRNKKI